jgi:hypothetical protein
MERTVKVLSVTLVTDVLTGNLVFQVSFGQIGKPPEGAAHPSIQQVASNVITIFLPSDKKCPYVAGSDWSMGIADNGNVELRQVSLG